MYMNRVIMVKYSIQSPVIIAILLWLCFALVSHVLLRTVLEEEEEFVPKNLLQFCLKFFLESKMCLSLRPPIRAILSVLDGAWFLN